MRESLGRIGPLKKSFDVMDVWLDSGLAWTCARKKEEREEKVRRRRRERNKGLIVESSRLRIRRS